MTEQLARCARDIITMLDDLSPQEQVACITGVLLSFVVMYAGDDGEAAIENIARKLPGQYAKVRENH